MEFSSSSWIDYFKRKAFGSIHEPENPSLPSLELREVVAPSENKIPGNYFGYVCDLSVQEIHMFVQDASNMKLHFSIENFSTQPKIGISGSKFM